MKKPYYIFLFALAILFSCGEEKPKELTLEQLQEIKKQSIEVNKVIVSHKRDSIITFLKEQNLNLTETGTGLWYKIEESDNTDTISSGDIIEYSYSISLLNGTLCYSSDSTGNKVVKVGQAGVESGLEEAFLLMNKGDKARLLIPPHLAHGLQGDIKKIPPLAILDYRVEILRHKKAD